ncbi:hypothetical protein CSC43_6945 [Pseudomonas aeruginosa]|nr:hypothetical protein CSC43_6945 [Pseudomonas aeruginosa]
MTPGGVALDAEAFQEADGGTHCLLNAWVAQRLTAMTCCMELLSCEASV